MIKRLEEMLDEEKIERFELIYQQVIFIYNSKVSSERVKDPEHYLFEETIEDCLAIDLMNGRREFWDHWNSLPDEDC